MATRPDLPLETLHGQWRDAIEAALGDRVTPADDVPAGYDHLYAVESGDTRRLVVVCPWHWPAYSHYQFWELASAPWLARRASYRDWCLVTNDRWTDWILPALTPLFGAVLVSDGPPIDGLRGWLDAEPTPVRLPRKRAGGRIALGEPTQKATTVTLKRAIAAALGPDARAGRTPPARAVEATLRPAFTADDDRTLIFAKSFRNPDVLHEARMMAGRALLTPDDHRPIVVIDGRWRDAPGLIAWAGADICTVDRLAEMLR